MCTLKVKPDVEKILKKLAKKNRVQVGIILHKVEEILASPHRYENFSTPLNDWKKVHVDKHFMLLFSVDHESNFVISINRKSNFNMRFNRMQIHNRRFPKREFMSRPFCLCLPNT